MKYWDEVLPSTLPALEKKKKKVTWTPTLKQHAPKCFIPFCTLTRYMNMADLTMVEVGHRWY